MRRFELTSTIGSDALTLVERPLPKTGPGQVLVRIRAAALNYRDLTVARGRYSRGVKLPLVPLSDCAGEVIEIGPRVSRVCVGDRVAALFFQRWLSGPLKPEMHDTALGGTMDGVLGEYVLLDADGVVRIPDHLSFAEGATLPTAALAAWHALIAAGSLQPGDTVLLLGTGGVSIFALQFASLAGARAIITSSNDAKLERARTLGAQETINYQTTPRWDTRVKELTNGRGVDHVVQVTGGSTLEQSFASLCLQGHVAIVGTRSEQPGAITPGMLVQYGARVSGINVGSREMFEAMNRAIVANRVRPVIDKSYAFEDAKRAYEDFSKAQHFGKVVIEL
jgi:NADPH:quinone reductase-like Zn-dependent oxidoreductase